MAEKKQFTVKFVLVGMTLLGVICAVAAKVFGLNNDTDSDFEAQWLFYVGVPIACGCLGAFIGGFWGRSVERALVGVLLFLTFVLVTIVLIPTVQ